jgi:phage gp36-like protein
VSAYCSLEDLTNLGICFDAIRTVGIDQQEAIIQATSDEMDGYFGSRYKLPLTAWGMDVRMMCARMSIYTLMVTRGFNPDNPGDGQLLEMHDMAERWLKRVSDGSLALTVTDSSNQGPGFIAGGVKVGSSTGRGYSSGGNSCSGGAFTGGRR